VCASWREKEKEREREKERELESEREKGKEREIESERTSIIQRERQVREGDIQCCQTDICQPNMRFGHQVQSISM
jgi:hypothetical protein